jgi:hypothetical protein
VRERFEVRHGQSESLADRLAGSPGGPEAVAALRDLGGRLHVHRSSGVHTDLAQMRSVVETIRDATGEAPLVIVDYLQKVAVGTATPRTSRSRRWPRGSRSSRWSWRCRSRPS